MFLNDIYTWKHQPPENRQSERLSFCVPATARLLFDPNVERQWKARTALQKQIALLGPRRPAETVPLLVRATDQHWTRLRSGVLRDRMPYSPLAPILDILAKFGPAAQDALPILDEILQNEDLAKRAEDGERKPDGTYRNVEDLRAWGLINSATAAREAILRGEDPIPADAEAH